MFTLAIVALLTTIALPGFLKRSASTKRAEAVMGLQSLRRGEEAFHQVHGVYTASMDTVGFTMDQGQQVALNAWQARYYTFSIRLLDDKGEHYNALASGDLDGDSFVDIVSIAR